MAKIIFINDPAATVGGALTILRQFLEEINKYSNKGFVYYVFCSTENLKKYENANIKIITDIKAKKWLDRLKWDFWGLKEWSKKNNIYADLIISFQNTAPFYFRNIKQILYLHQLIPFFKEIQWNIFKKEERTLWFYKNIYPYFIRLNLKNVNYLIVQTEWMREAVREKFGSSPEKVIQISPSFSSINIDNISKIDFKDNKFHIFYPAPPSLYKNHELIIKALIYIKQNSLEIYNNLIVHFTFKAQEAKRLTTLIDAYKLEDIIKYEGNLDYQKVLEYYKSVDLVAFPSYIESFPLPLYETALFGLPILVSDLPFSREILQNYQGAQFLDYQNNKIWANKIIELYNKRPHYNSFTPKLDTSWKDFFDLINNLLLNS